MKTDDPKLTAFALGELDESERSTIAREIADSLEAQRVVGEIHEMAQALRKEFASDLETSHSKVATGPASLIDIRDDPWFWSIARPLAIAAVITILAIVGAITIAKYKLRSDTNVIAGGNFADIQAEETPQAGEPSDFIGPEHVRNPLRANVIQGIEHVVIGELNPESKDGEIRVIETINDRYRIGRLKGRLTAPTLSKKSHRSLAGGAYQLMFLDHNGHVVASAGFYRSPEFGFVLQPSKYGYERDGRYFAGSGGTVLPGDWESGIDYFGYVIPFSDWSDCVGYSPGA